MKTINLNILKNSQNKNYSKRASMINKFKQILRNNKKVKTGNKLKKMNKLKILKLFNRQLINLIPKFLMKNLNKMSMKLNNQRM